MHPNCSNRASKRKCVYATLFRSHISLCLCMLSNSWLGLTVYAQQHWRGYLCNVPKTHTRQPYIHSFILSFRLMTLETGKLAKFADGCAVAKVCKV